MQLNKGLFSILLFGCGALASFTLAQASNGPNVTSNKNFARTLIVGSDDFLSSSLYANEAASNVQIQERAQYLEKALGFDRATSIAAAFLDVLKNIRNHEDLVNPNVILSSYDTDDDVHNGKEPDFRFSNPENSQPGTSLNKNNVPSGIGNSVTNTLKNPVSNISANSPLGVLGLGDVPEDDAVVDKKWDFNITPMLYARLEIPTKLLTLNTHFQTRNGLDLANAPEEEKTLKIAPQSGPFRVELKRGLKLSAGVTSKLKEFSTGATGFVGLAPIWGRSGLTEKTVVGDEKAVRKTSRLSIPETVDDLQYWSLFDKFTLSSTGGVIFIAGISYSGLTAGLTYTAESEWSTIVQKIGNTKIFAKHVNRKEVSIAPYLGTAIISGSISRVTSVDDSFSFCFDLADPVALDAFHSFVKGDARPTQALALKKETDSVVKVDQEKSKSIVKLKSVRVGVPSVIGVAASTGNVQVVTANENFLDNTKTNVAYGIYVKNRVNRIGTLKDESTSAFYGADYSITDADGKVRAGRFGQFTMSYRDNIIYSEGMQSIIQNLVNRTGFSKELWVNVPHIRGSLGYMIMDFQLKFSRQATEAIAAMNSNNEKLRQLEQSAITKINDFFKLETPEDRRDEPSICVYFKVDQNGSASARMTAKELRETQLDLCRASAVRSSKSAVRGLKVAIEKMAENMNKDSKKFAAAYAEFGKAMMKNRFIFQAVFDAVKENGVSARYLIGGTRIASYDLSFDWGPVVVPQSCENQSEEN